MEQITREELKELSRLLERASDLAYDYERDALADKLNTASVRLLNLSQANAREEAQ